MYHYIIKQLVRKSFGLVNDRKFNDLAKAMSTNVLHSFAGAHALGGVRNDQAAVKAWLERLARIMPNLHIEVDNINVQELPIIHWLS